jgi:hypothetical protein
MTASSLARWIARLSLLVVLLAVGSYLLLKPYLGDQETIWKDGAVTEVAHRGPVTVEHVTWKLDSLQVHTRLVDAEKKPIDLDVPAGAVIVLAKVSITPRDGLRINGGFPCEANLRDDRGNVWKAVSAYGLALPTYCADDDHPMPRNRTAQLAQVYVVPKSAVPHLVGITTESLDERRRVLLTW